jgi:hypothetical protein
MKSSGRKRRAPQTRMARKAQATNFRKAAEKAGREPRVQR